MFGQGTAILMAIPDGETYKYVLIDNNNDQKKEGIDIKRLLSDLLGDNSLDVFINTHPQLFMPQNFKIHTDFFLRDQRNPHFPVIQGHSLR